MEFIIIIQHGTNIKIMAQKLWPWNKSKIYKNLVYNKSSENISEGVIGVFQGIMHAIG